MTMHILSDNDAEKSVMWDDTTGRTYGYVTTGPGHREMLQAFMDGLATHVAAYDPHELSALWDAFNDTVSGTLAETQATVAEAPTVPPDPTQVGGGEQTTPAPDTSVASTSGTAPGESSDSEAPVDPTMSPSSPSSTQPSSSGMSAATSSMQCFNCKGTGKEPITQSECGVCEGTGVITISPSDPQPSE